MTRHARLVAAASIVLATFVGSLAIAQQPKRGARPTRPKPATERPQSDAGAETKPDDEKEKGNPSPSMASLDAGATGVNGSTATGPAELGDGGTRLSPLTPAPAEMPGASLVDGGAPSLDYDRLLSEIAALRARVAAVGESLFQSRMAIAVRADGDRGRVAKVTLSVDDGVVYTSPQGFRGDEATPVFARALAPGRHAVTVDVEREDRENPAFRSGQRSRFVVEVPRDAQLDVTVRVEDDSSMGDLPSKKKGEYDLRVRLKASSSPIKR